MSLHTLLADTRTRRRAINPAYSLRVFGWAITADNAMGYREIPAAPGRRRRDG